MRHGSRRPGFSQEPLARRRGQGEFGAHQLDRYDTVQLLIECFGDDAKRAASEDRLDFVVFGYLFCFLVS